MKKNYDKVTLVIKCNQSAADSMIPLLKEFRAMGGMGSSRSVRIEDWHGENNFGFDGDGPDNIESIELDGELIKSVNPVLRPTMEKVVGFFRENPNFTSAQIDSWATGNALDSAAVGQVLYALKEVVKARMIRASCGDEMEYKLRKEGLYKDENGSVSAPAAELEMGIKVEMKEHTKSRKIARQIALDHLMEDGKYYTHLKEMEEKHMEKARKMPIGTISRGRKKVAEGKWVPVGSGGTGDEASGARKLIAEEKRLKKKLSTLDENASWKESKQVDEITGRLGAIKDELREMHYQKSTGGTKMKKSGIALVLIPGELSKAAKLSSVGAKHPAGLSGVKGKTKSKIPYTGHVERMKLAKMAMARMLEPKPEDAGKYADNPVVDRKGRVKGAKAPYSNYGTGVSGMGSQAHDMFGRTTLIVKPSEIGSSPPEGSTAHTPIRNVR